MKRLALLGLALVSACSPSGSWQYREGKFAMTDKPRFLATVKDPQSNAILHLECDGDDNRKIWVSVEIPFTVMSNGNVLDSSRMVDFRLDGGAPGHTVGTFDGPLLWFKTDKKAWDAEILNGLRGGAKKLALAFTDPSGTSREVIFDVTGGKSAIERGESYCSRDKV